MGSSRQLGAQAKLNLASGDSPLTVAGVNQRRHELAAVQPNH